jgi:hypothetical protein
MKLIWTESDFEQMNWHDVTIHGMAFNSPKYELLIDLDYLFKWIEPQPPSNYYSYIIASATLVFKNVWNFKCDFTTNLNPTISTVSRENEGVPRNAGHIAEQVEWIWVIELFEGEITFNSAGFTQYTRKKPEQFAKQAFSFEQRNGICFDKIETLT